MGVVKTVFTGVKQGAKYAPVVIPVVREMREPATAYAKRVIETSRQRRLAVTKAASLREGTVLRVLHGEDPVWVVYSGDEPVSAHPAVDVPLAELVQHANLDLRRRPEEFPTARERAASAGRTARSKVHLPHRRRSADDSAVDADAELVGEGVGELDELGAADGGAAQAGEPERGDEPRA